jgi:hypothetical protein
MDLHIILLRQSVLFVLGIGGWLAAYFSHKRCASSSREALRLPRLLASLFGSFRPDGVLNYRSMLLQMAIYVCVPTITLMNLEIITRQMMIEVIGWSGVGLAIFAVLLGTLKR